MSDTEHKALSFEEQAKSLPQKPPLEDIAGEVGRRVDLIEASLRNLSEVMQCTHDLLHALAEDESE